MVAARRRAARSFVGDRVYEHESRSSRSIGRRRASATRRATGDEVQVVTAETPFYGESGGQVGDRGVIETADGALIEIVDTQKPRADLTVHVGKVVARRAAERRARPPARRSRAPRGGAAQSLGHAHPARRAARAPRHARAPGRIAGRARSAALRLQLRRPGRRRARCGASRTEVNAHIRENAEVRTEEMAYDDAIKRRRAGVLRRQVRRPRARRAHRRLLHRAVRRHARAARRRHRPLQAARRERRRRRRAPHRGADRRRGAATGCASREQTLREVGDLLRGSRRGRRRAGRAAGRATARAREAAAAARRGSSPASQSDELLQQARDGRRHHGHRRRGRGGRSTSGLRELADRLREQHRLRRRRARPAAQAIVRCCSPR